MTLRPVTTYVRHHQCHDDIAEVEVLAGAFSYRFYIMHPFYGMLIKPDETKR
jgi:hypothetical protein